MLAYLNTWHSFTIIEFGRERFGVGVTGSDKFKLPSFVLIPVVTPHPLSPATEMFSIANTETRRSLKAVFENIFAKYGRDFVEDDEIDLVSLEVTKPGGHLARIKPLQFGEAFRRKMVQSPEASPAFEATEEDIFGLDKGVLGHSEDDEQATRATATQLRFNLVNAIAQSGTASRRKKLKGTPNRGQKRRKRKIVTFDTVLTEILEEEARAMVVGLRAPHATGCFDCLLFTAIMKEQALPTG